MKRPVMSNGQYFEHIFHKQLGEIRMMNQEDYTKWSGSKSYPNGTYTWEESLEGLAIAFVERLEARLDEIENEIRRRDVRI